MNIRFAIWCAVSTESQAKGWDKIEGAEEEDKTSLENQERSSRVAGQGKGWVESAGPFVVPGQSRTRWVNLRDAENEIPALHAMLDSAKRREFDVLVMYDYNRLRDLVDSVAKTLAFYGTQIYSVNQPVEPISPEQYDPYSNDAESMMRGMSQILSRAQISDLRRKFQFGIPARVRKGLHSTGFPWGYSRKDQKSIPVPVPSQARIIIEIKDLFLTGKGIHKIVDHLNANYPTPKGGRQWETAPVKYILQNYYYAGKVSFGKTKTVRDPHHNTRHIIKKDAPDLLLDGKHQALYSWDEYLLILLEFERRQSLPNNRQYPWSGLLECSICKKKLNHVSTNHIWRCKYMRTGVENKDHIGLLDNEALDLLPVAIQKAIVDYKIVPTPRFAQTTIDQAALNDLEKQRQHVQEMCRARIYSIAEAEQEIGRIEKQITAIKDVEKNQQRLEAKYQQWVVIRNRISENIERFPQWIIVDEPREVNELLSQLCREIVISPDRQIKVNFPVPLILE